MHPPTPPKLDRMGHVPFKIPTNSHMTSIDRLPADGHSDEYHRDIHLINEGHQRDIDQGTIMSDNNIIVLLLLSVCS